MEKETLHIADKSQVKSKERVTEHGEVFTAEREVNAMLDLVKQETERIDSRFLEPACGDGNFLVEILHRKLEVVESRYAKSQLEYERYAILALSSIYGVDKLEDNVKSCRARLLSDFNLQYRTLYKKTYKPQCLITAEFILSRNILWGDALTLKSADGKEEPIVFSEWAAVNGSNMKRRDFTFLELSKNVEYDNDANNLFSDIGEPVFIPAPYREFPVTHFLNLAEIT